MDSENSCGSAIPQRMSMDHTVNSLGRKLLNMCTITGLLILNGRIHGDKTGKFTFCNQMGYSVIDYVFAKYENFNIGKIGKVVLLVC